MSAQPPNLLTPNQIDTLLYKKYVNVANAKPSVSHYQDLAVNAAPKIFPGKQIYSQPVPDTAPTDLIVDSTFNALYGIRKVSRSYPYMVKYENLTLTSITVGVSYKSDTRIGQTNLLQYAIPFNYDTAYSYDIQVRDTNGNLILPTSTLYPWSLDCDAGVLTFYGRSLDLDNVVPRITFWRYEGRMGLVPYDVCGNQIGGTQQSVGWSQSANGVDIYNTNPATARVAIGLDAPTATLDVSGSVRIRAGGQLDASGATIRTGTILPPGSQQPLTLLTDASGSLRVGIGTSTPAYNLDVSGTARLARMEIAGTATMSNGLDVSGIVIARNIIAAPTIVNGATVNSDPTVGIILKQASTTATNVGIGADPGSTTRLRVLGSTSLEGSVTVQNQLKIVYEQNDGNNAFVIDDQRNDATPFIVDADGNVGISADINQQTGYASVRSLEGVPYKLDVHGRTITDGLDVSGSANIGGGRFIVDSSGVKSIGLDVSGSARVTGTLTAGSIALNNVAVTGSSTFANGVDISGTTIMRSADITTATIGTSTTTGQATFNSGIDVSGQTTLRGSLAVGQSATFDSSVQVTGEAFFVAGVQVQGQQTNTGTLQVNNRQGAPIFTADTSNNRVVLGEIIVDGTTGKIGIGKQPAAQQQQQQPILDVSGDVAINNLLKLNTVGLKGGSGAGNTNFSLKLPGALPDAISTLSADASGSLFWMADSSQWLNRYIIDAPPAITGASVISRTTEIVFTWNYPTQIYAGFTDKLLPTITTLNVVLKRGADSLLTQILGAGSPSAAQFVKETASPAAPITGIILSKRTGTNGIITRSGRRYYIFYSYESALDASNNRLTIWYSNFNAVSQNPINIVFNSFGQTSPPAAPANLRQTGSTAASLALLFTTGLVDSGDATSTDVHSAFDISYNAVANTVRYGGMIPDSGALANWLVGQSAGSLTDVAGTLAALYPDTTYALAIRGKSQFAGLLGPYSSLATFTTGALAPAVTMPSILEFTTARYYNPGAGGVIKVAETGVTVENVHNKFTYGGPWTSSPFNVPIHVVANRGSGVASLMRIRTNLTTTGPSITFAGFATSAVPSAQSANSVTLTPTNYTDSYASTASLTGYYRHIVATVSIAAGALPARNTPFTLTLYRDVSGATGWQQVDTATHTFYMDTYSPGTTPALSGTPSFTVTGTTINITGVPVISSASTVNAQLAISLQNLGVNFYRSPYLTYTCAPLTLANTEETVITPVGSTVPTTVVVNRSTEFTGLTADTFARSLTLSYTAYNQTGRNITGTITSPAVIDSLPADYTTTAPTILPGGPAQTGMHNNLIDASGAFTTNYTAVVSYDHTTSIVGTAALQIVRRKWRTKTAAGTDGYAAYATVNYSSIPATDYRVAAFTWLLNQGSTYGGRYTITLTGTEGITSANAQQILLYYRIINIAGTTPSGPSSQSTVWINGATSDAANPVGSSNYYDTTRSGILTGLVSRTVASTTVTYVVNAPPFVIPSGQNVALYVYVGLPMDTAMAFSGVTVNAAA